MLAVFAGLYNFLTVYHLSAVSERQNCVCSFWLKIAAKHKKCLLQLSCAVASEVLQIYSEVQFNELWFQTLIFDAQFGTWIMDVGKINALE